MTVRGTIARFKVGQRRKTRAKELKQIRKAQLAINKAKKEKALAARMHKLGLKTAEEKHKERMEKATELAGKSLVGLSRLLSGAREKMKRTAAAHSK